MNRRRLHDYDDGFDEAHLWDDEDLDLEAHLWGDEELDLYGDPEFEDLTDMNKEMDFDLEDTEARYRMRSEPTRWTDRGARARRLVDNRRRERRRARAKSWDEFH